MTAYLTLFPYAYILYCILIFSAYSIWISCTVTPSNVDKKSTKCNLIISTAIAFVLVIVGNFVIRSFW